MSKIRCLLVDDEAPALALLQQYAGMLKELDVVASVQSAVKAFDVLTVEHTDLMFLDIQMPVLNGIDFIKTLRHPPSIILTTAFREYALDGYDLDIIDYLLKPISFDRFLKAVDRYRNRQVKPVLQKTEAVSHPEYIYFVSNRKQHKVILDEILYLESLKDYVRIHTIKESLVIKGNIGSILNQLPEDLLVRIHRSYAVSPNHVKAFDQKEVIIGEQSLPIGVRYRKLVHFK